MELAYPESRPLRSSGDSTFSALEMALLLAGGFALSPCRFQVGIPPNRFLNIEADRYPQSAQIALCGLKSPKLVQYLNGGETSQKS